MDYDALIGALGNPQPDVRLNAIRIIGMVEETRALDALKLAYTMEDAPEVKQAIGLAGQRLMAAQKAGHSTQAAVMRYFGVDKEIESANEVIAAETSGTAFGSSSHKEDYIETGKKRAPATRPSDTDIRVWVRRIRELTDPVQRKKAVIQLAALHNPEALPHLAQVFTSDADQDVRQAAQHYGQVLYWGILYFQMDRDGSLQEEMDRRIEAGRKAAEAQRAAAPTPPPEAAPKELPSDDIADILRRAEEGRKRRTQTNRKL